MHIHIIKSKVRVVVLAAGMILSGAANAAGLVEVKQTVFGMDCAPCAHGIKKGLEKLKGVENASVSLNDGYASLTLAPDNTVTMEKIRQVVEENGFTPKDATVVIIGTVERDNGDQWVLKTSADQVYALNPASGNKALRRKLQALPAGSLAEIKGHLAESGARDLTVLAVSPEA